MGVGGSYREGFAPGEMPGATAATGRIAQLSRDSQRPVPLADDVVFSTGARGQLFHCRLDADALGSSRDFPELLLEPFQRFRRDLAPDVPDQP